MNTNLRIRGLPLFCYDQIPLKELSFIHILYAFTIKRSSHTFSFVREPPCPDMASRELTAAERAAIKELAVKLCANYDGCYKECLLLDCPCYMFGKWWTGGYCKYFKNAVLPNNPALYEALTGDIKTRPCALCGRAFPISGKRAYCSAACERNALRKQKREYMRKKRDRRGNLPF